MRALSWFFLLAFLGWTGGFVWFVSHLPRAQTGDLPQFETPYEDGIVALTGGGGKRISQALELLMAGQGTRLLISGVHSQTTSADLAATQPGFDAAFACCIDIGYEATTTRGNATEVAAWVATHGFDQIFLVTTDYHVPRAQLEIRREIPTVNIVPWPVASSAVPADGWMSSPQAWKILSLEYSKYLFARVAALLP